MIVIHREITKKQSSILKIIIDYQYANGYSPTIREIAERVKLSINMIVKYLNALEKKQYIKRDKNVARSIVVLKESM